MKVRNFVILMDRLKYSFWKVMCLFFLITTSCTTSLSEESIVGTWKIEHVKTETLETNSETLWVNKTGYLVNNIFKENDEWTFTKSKQLKHQGVIAIWPRPQTYKLENNHLLFFLGVIDKTHTMNEFAQFIIINKNKNSFSLRSTNKKNKTVVVLKRLMDEKI